MRWKFWNRQPDFAKQLGMTPPPPNPDRSGLALVFIAQNEAAHVREWIRYYQHVGVDFFIGYNDGSTDGTFDIIEELLPAKNRAIFPWRNRDLNDPRRGRYINNQVLAYFHAIGNFGSNFRWMTFIDLDEFIIPRQHNTIVEALEKVDDFPNVSLPWHMFGFSGHDVPPDGGIIRNYTKRARDPMSDMTGIRNFKCIVDPCEVTQVSIHGFQTRSQGDKTCNDQGLVFPDAARKDRVFYSNEFLQLNHYYTRSSQELDKKLKRGSASPVNNKIHQDRVMVAVNNIESDLVEDVEMIRFLDRTGFDLSEGA